MLLRCARELQIDARVLFTNLDLSVRGARIVTRLDSTGLRSHRHYQECRDQQREGCWESFTHRDDGMLTHGAARNEEKELAARRDTSNCGHDERQRYRAKE